MSPLNALEFPALPKDESLEDDFGALGQIPAMVRIDALRKYSDVVKRLGGSPDSLLSKAQIDPASLNNPHAVIPYRSLVLLLERSAAELDCPDFGMRFAALQSGIKVLGPLEFLMCNSNSVREAFQLCKKYCPQVYSTASRTVYKAGYIPDTVFLHFQILVNRLPHHPQSVERALLLVQNCALKISKGRVRALEIWLAHQPLSPPSVYFEYFGTQVRFGQAMNGLLFRNQDLDLPIPDVDPQVHELTMDFIEHQYPQSPSILSTRVRSIIELMLLDGNCTYIRVASALSMHPRTLQRRLQAEGGSFDTIKDSVRRDIALRFLKQTSVPLIRIARMLGYSETSALCRSCHRWFGSSPNQIRNGETPVLSA